MFRKLPCLFHIIQLIGIIYNQVTLIIGKSGLCIFQTVDDTLRLLCRGKVVHHYYLFFIQVNLKVIKLRPTGISAAVHNDRDIISPIAFQTIMDILPVLFFQLCKRTHDFLYFLRCLIGNALYLKTFRMGNLQNHIIRPDWLLCPFFPCHFFL